MIDTVIFDMDGTVLNTLEDLTVSVNHVLRQFGYPECTEKECRAYFGNGIRHALECALQEDISENTMEKMLLLFRTHYNEHCLDRTRPYDGIPALMRRLKRDGFKMAIVSNKIDSAVKELNNRFFADHVSVAIGERQGIKRKPAPDTVLAALAELESTRERSVYIGDSEVDHLTAVNSGLPCISVLWGFRDRDFLIEHGASVFAKTPDEIIDRIHEIESRDS